MREKPEFGPSLGSTLLIIRTSQAHFLVNECKLLQSGAAVLLCRKSVDGLSIVVLLFSKQLCTCVDYFFQTTSIWFSHFTRPIPLHACFTLTNPPNPPVAILSPRSTQQPAVAMTRTTTTAVAAAAAVAMAGLVNQAGGHMIQTYPYSRQYAHSSATDELPNGK